MVAPPYTMPKYSIPLCDDSTFEPAEVHKHPSIKHTIHGIPSEQDIGYSLRPQNKSNLYPCGRLVGGPGGFVCGAGRRGTRAKSTATPLEPAGLYSTVIRAGFWHTVRQEEDSCKIRNPSSYTRGSPAGCITLKDVVRCAANA